MASALGGLKIILERGGLLILVSLLFFVAPSLTPRDQGLLVLGFLFATMAIGLQLVVGFCRLFDLGFAGFVCLGAYTTGITMVDWGWSFISAILLSALVAFLFGVLLGLPTLRLESDYFAIVTFGLAELIVMVVRNWEAVTRGPYGFGGVPDPLVLGMTISRYPPLDYVYLLGVVFLLIYTGVYYLRWSLLGRQMLVVGEGYAYANLCGVDVVAIKVSAFGLSAAVGGIVGSMWAVYFKFFSYLDFSLILSVQVLMIVVLAGGRDPSFVALVGLLLGPVGEYLRRLVRTSGLGAGSWVIAFGILLIALSRGRFQYGRESTDLRSRWISGSFRWPKSASGRKP